MTIILVLFAVAQLVAPVLLVRFFRWKGILGAFIFTAALHYAFHRAVWPATLRLRARMAQRSFLSSCSRLDLFTA